MDKVRTLVDDHPPDITALRETRLSEAIGDHEATHKSFNCSTETNTANYQPARSTINPILVANSGASLISNLLIRLPSVRVSAVGSFELPAVMQQAAVSTTENKEEPMELKPDGDLPRSSIRFFFELPAVIQQAAVSITGNKEEPMELMPDGDPSIKLNPNAVSPGRFVNYAASLVRSPNPALTSQFLPLRCTEADQVTLEALAFLLSVNNAFGIYSESPFLRPVTLLRPVRFASPANIFLQYPDPENMVRTLRDLADQKVTSIPLLAILSGAKPNAASLGFYTGYLTYSFTLEVDNNTMRILVDQSRRPHDGADKYRLILRLAWATAGLYMPRDKSNPSRVLACEVLPRCLSVRVARRNVALPDPIFHGGQAQKFGHRLRFAIDITDKIVTRSNSSVRGRGVEIDLTWLHAPLEDHALPLLEMVGSGSCTPILNHLLNLPLIQVTLDRVQPIPEFVRMFSSAVAGEPVTDPPPGCQLPLLPSETPEALVGAYDFCMSSDRVIAASETLAMVKSKLTSEDDLQSDGWIPVSLLCPLALTRIEIPVRSANCDHLQCFDLSSYLTINKKRPRWSCPVCSSPAPFRDLRRDDFFVQLMADQSLKDADMVHVDANGHWREASKPTENDSSAAVAAKGLICGIPSNNSTTVTVPSQLDETSAMSPCIMESDFSSRSVASVEPDVGQFSDSVVHLDDRDDYDDQEGSATQPEQPTFAHPTSFNDCCTPSPPAAVTDEQPSKLPSAAIDSAPTKPSASAKRKTTPRDPGRRTNTEEVMGTVNSEKIVEYCQARGLLPTVLTCQCRYQMRLQVRKRSTDGYVFGCSRCRKRKALRSGSVFERSRLAIGTIMRILLAFLRGTRVSKCEEDVGVCHTTAVEWYAICRSVCSAALMRETGQIGGPGVEVHIDKTLINRRNFNVGGRRRRWWLVGMYDTKRKKALFEQVNDRSWTALISVIRRWVAKGSVIVTDEWKTYKRLPSEGYKHFSVNHSKNSKDPTTGKYTNAIEAYWSRLKRKLHEGGPVSGPAIWTHVDEVRYRLWFGLNSMRLEKAWEIFLSHIAKAYTVQQLPTCPK
ncbi:hypothetical protein SprV_0902666100 [Sparganum proliferum]